MTEQIARQTFDVVIMVGCGMAMMLLLEIRNSFLKKRKWRKPLELAIYFFPWICNGYLFSCFLYTCAHGVPYIHCIVATLIGVLIWKKLFYGLVDFEREDELYEKQIKKNENQ